MLKFDLCLWNLTLGVKPQCASSCEAERPRLKLDFDEKWDPLRHWIIYCFIWPQGDMNDILNPLNWREAALL
jgi:hypothetical protein